jgi:hypothetical protein
MFALALVLPEPAKSRNDRSRALLIFETSPCRLHTPKRHDIQHGKNVHLNQRSLSQSNRASNWTASDRDTSTLPVAKNEDKALEGDTHLNRSPNTSHALLQERRYRFSETKYTAVPVKGGQTRTKSLDVPLMRAESIVKAFGPRYQVCFKTDHREAVFPDPQTGIALGIESLTGRNVRSNGRCSCVLQFTVSPALCGALHRPTSLVIHRSG